jgi:hypothetical protein
MKCLSVCGFPVAVGVLRPLHVPRGLSAPAWGRIIVYLSNCWMQSVMSQPLLCGNPEITVIFWVCSGVLMLVHSEFMYLPFSLAFNVPSNGGFWWTLLWYTRCVERVRIICRIQYISFIYILSLNTIKILCWCSDKDWHNVHGETYVGCSIPTVCS